MQDRAHAEGGGADAEEAGSQAKGIEHATAGSGKSSAHETLLAPPLTIMSDLLCRVVSSLGGSDGVIVLYVLHHTCCLSLRGKEIPDA